MGGRYDGNDALYFLKIYITDGRGRAYIWEPDSENARRISKTLQGFEDSYEVKPFALWSRREQLHFSGTGSVISQLSKYGKITVNADSIDNHHFHEHITFIKMDIEGAEPEALLGAEKTILKYKPKLAICIYHQPAHLYEIPLWIKSKVPEYKIYIRHHSNALNETVCYAVM